MTDLRWYTTLALWKSIVFMEGNYKRAVAGATDDPYLKDVRRRRASSSPSRAEAHGPTVAERGAAGLAAVDWGGVLTSNLFALLRARSATNEGLDADALRRRFPPRPRGAERC